MDKVKKFLSDYGWLIRVQRQDDQDDSVFRAIRHAHDKERS